MINTPPNYFKRNSSILPPNSSRYISPNISPDIMSDININITKSPRQGSYQYDSDYSNSTSESATSNFNHTHIKKSKESRSSMYELDDDINSVELLDLSSDSLFNLNETKKSNILWSSETIMTLFVLEDKINHHKLMQPLGHIVRYYINKHQPYDHEYKIRLVDTVPVALDKNILILAYICEIRLKNSLNFDTVITVEMIHSSIGKIIYEVISDIFRYDSWELSYEELFLVNLLSDILPLTKTARSREIITTAYYITRYIIRYINSSHNHIIDYISTAVVRAQEVNMSIFDSIQIRDCLSVMKTKRRLYLRLLIVICGYMLHANIDRIINIIFKQTEISNQRQFDIMLNDMMMEIIITITGYIIKTK
jgi:hypothetical protein